VILYGVLGAVGAIVMVFALSRSVVYEANLLRLSGSAPMVVDGTTIRNAFEIHLVNKRAQPIRLSIAGAPSAQLHYTIAMPEARLASLQHLRVPVFVSFERGAVRDGERAELIIRASGEEEARSLHAPLIAPPPF
jgi:hypothetical protein